MLNIWCMITLLFFVVEESVLFRFAIKYIYLCIHCIVLIKPSSLIRYVNALLCMYEWEVLYSIVT